MRSVVVWGRWLHMVNGMEEGDESGGRLHMHAFLVV